jgi:hypothetical protein
MLGCWPIRALFGEGLLSGVVGSRLPIATMPNLMLGGPTTVWSRSS